MKKGVVLTGVGRASATGEGPSGGQKDSKNASAHTTSSRGSEAHGSEVSWCCSCGCWEVDSPWD